MKLGKRIPTKYSAIFLISIFVLGLITIVYFNYILNIQYQDNKMFLKGPFTLPPKTLRLDLDQPDDDSLTFQSSIIVSGQTSPLKDVLIFTSSKNLVIKSKKDGSFSTVLGLDKGVNNITVAVFDATGDSRSVKRMVYYSEEKL